MIKWFIEGEPIAWTAPKAGKNGFYQGNKDLKAWKDVCSLYANTQWNKPPAEGPCKVLYVFYRTPPKSWPKWKKEYQAGCLIQEKPDSDNLAKAVTDALEDIVFSDDGRLAHLEVEKRWREPGDSPGVYIEIETYQAYPETKKEMKKNVS